MSLLLKNPTEKALTLIAMTTNEWDPGYRQRFDAPTLNWLDSLNYPHPPNTWCPIPDATGVASRFIATCVAQPLWALAHLSATLPSADYLLQCDWSAADRQQAALGWLLAGYRFNRYRNTEPVQSRLWVGEDVDRNAVEELAATITIVRDLINTPAMDMMPQDLSRHVATVATQFDADHSHIIGNALLTENFPAIHSVGRASAHAPRFIELRWDNTNGSSDGRRVTVIGKGVCFDSGGLNLKSGSGLRLMKKDMGGAAHALGLAILVMQCRLPVYLRLLIPAVDNAISGDAYRPGDVLMTRKGSRVEVGNTDAEGRIVLADALTAAMEESPDLVIDFATLTGAARVALGAELPALFSNDDDLAAAILAQGEQVSDPLWRLPLYAPYRELLDSNIGDICNHPSGAYAGAITAALFLEHFITANTPWVHIDLMAWNLKSRPGRPEGGEAMALRALLAYLQQRYPTSHG